MKSKALIVGALPNPFVGPWSSLENLLWLCAPSQNFKGRVVIEVHNNGRDIQLPLNGEPLRLSGQRARVLVLGELPENVERVTVRIYADDQLE